MQCQTYFLNGDAQLAGEGCYQLTQASGNQNGTVWYADEIDLTEPFELEFTMNFGISDAGADGMVFVLQEEGTDALGTSGGGMGYLGFNTSFGVEFDTWQNIDNGDPTFDHIGMISNGSVNHNSAQAISEAVQASIFSTNIEDGQDHIVTISWSPNLNNIKVLFDCEPRLNENFDLEELFSDSLVYFGFTGATGGAWNNQTVCLSDYILSVGPAVTICNGASTQLIVGGNADGTYTWSPAESLDDPNSVAPTATPTETTTYSVVYEDLCGQTESDTVTVSVEDLETWIDPVGTLTCAEPEVELFGNNNFDNQVGYSWETDDGSIASGGNTSSPIIDGPGTYVVEANFDNLCFAYDTITVEGNYVFDVSVGASELLLNCDNDLSEIDATSSGGPFSSYTWTTSGGNIVDGQGTDEISVNQGGTYTVEAFVSEECNGTASVTINENFDEITIDPGPPQVLDCNNTNVQIEASGNASDGLIFWSTLDGNITGGLTSLTPTVNEAGTYTVTAIHEESQCETTASVSVSTNISYPEVFAGTNDTISCEEPYAAIMDASTNIEDYTALWTTNDGSIETGFTILEAVFQSEGTYTLTITDSSNGCSSSDDVQVFVDPNYFLDIDSFTLPNVFSPNNDQRNDYWKPFLASNPEFDLEPVIGLFELRIFNRWGNLVHESDIGDRGWDGRSNGEFLAGGTYYYILDYTIECASGADETKTGFIELIVE